MMKSLKTLYAAHLVLLLVATGAKADPWPLSDVPRSGDDTLKSGLAITTGVDGVCDTEKHPKSDDVQVIQKGQTAAPYTPCITAGNDGILGYHPEPRGMSTMMGEYSRAWMKLHEGIDIPGLLNTTACIAMRKADKGYWNEGGTGENSYVDLTFYDGTTASFRYYHTAWDDKDGDKPAARQVVANEVISRLVQHPLYPHLHLEASVDTRAGLEQGYRNPLQYFSQKPQYDQGYPEIIRNTYRGQQVPRIFAVPDKSFMVGFDAMPNGKVVVTGDADIVVETRSRAWDFFNKDKNLTVTDIWLIPYEAKVSITGPNNYTFDRTLFRMDVLPSDGTKRAAKADLIYHKLSQPYNQFYLVLTNSDGSTNFDYLNNVKEGSWPVGQKDDQNNWLIPNGEYTITVTIKDYEGATAEATKTVVVDHGYKKPVAKK